MIKMSESIAKIAESFSAAQSEIGNAKKDTKADKYKYADLSQIIEMVKAVFPIHGLSFIQPVSSNESGELMVTTYIMHSSGEYISTTAKLPDAILYGSAAKNPVQVAGAAITYMRRYQLAGMVGIAQEDDDASGYVKNNKNKPVSNVPADMFDCNKDKWASTAKKYGGGGMDKLKNHLIKENMKLSIDQEAEIQNIIIELSKTGT